MILEVNSKNKIYYLDIIFIALFVLLLIKLPDIDIQEYLENLGINSSFKLIFCLVVLLILTMIIICYSKIMGGILFICITLFLRTQFKYIEAFQKQGNNKSVVLNNQESFINSNNNNYNKNNNYNSNSGDNNITVEKYLLNQIADDPNKTSLEKKIIQDITQKYFLESDKLQKLTDFNNNSDTYSLTKQ